MLGYVQKGMYNVALISHTIDNEFNEMIIHVIRQFGVSNMKSAMVKSNAQKHPGSVSRDESNSSKYNDEGRFGSNIDDLEFENFNNQLLGFKSAANNDTEDDGKGEEEITQIREKIGIRCLLI
eukprot:15346195-Ditylum_brightwellii.AAC.1